jgi:O-antigen ligase
LSWVLAGVALSVVALWQWASGSAFWNPQLQTGAFRRVTGPFADPNTFASFLNVAAVFALNRLAARDGRPAPWLLGLGVLGAGLFVTFSRSGWLALASVVVLWGLFLARTRRALAIFAVMLAAGAGVLALVPSVLARLENLGSYESVSVRPELIEVGLLMFREQPLTGLGIGSFQLAVATAYSYAYPFFWYVTASHTSFVTTAAELGLPGLLCTAGLLFTALVQAYLLAVDRRLSSFLRSSARALILAVVVLVVAGQTTGALFEEPYVWIALGMIVAVRRCALEERERMAGW